MHETADLELLFEDIAYYGNQNISFESLRTSLDHLLDYYWKLDREQELFDVLPKGKLVCVIDGIKMISLKVVRRFAAQLGISLFDLFTGNAHQTSAILDFREYCSLPPLIDFSHRQGHNHEKVLDKLVSLRMDNRSNPLSLKQFARELDVSVGYLEYRHPALSKQIVHDYQEHQRRLQLAMEQEAKNQAIVYFLERKHRGNYVSRKQAYRDLRCETNLPKFKLKSAINIAFEIFMA